MKSRNFAFIIYPESLPENWLDLIDNKLIPCILSPLHDKDKTQDGKFKKAHYHLMVHYANTTTDKYISNLFRDLNGTSAIVINDWTAYFEYLIHKNQPDKFQYDFNDIKYFNGATPASDFQNRNFLSELLDYSMATRCYNFRDLISHYLNDSDMIDFIRKNVFLISQIIKVR